MPRNKKSAIAAVVPLKPVAATPADETAAVKPAKGASKDLAERWGSDAIRAGWVALPSIVLEKQHALSLDPIDINIILQIAKHWFDAKKLPHPSKGSIARAMNVEPRTIQKRLRRLEELGFVKRIYRSGPRGNNTSEFDFGGLVERIEPFAREALAQRDENRKRKIEQLRRRKPEILDEEEAA